MEHPQQRSHIFVVLEQGRHTADVRQKVETTLRLWAGLSHGLASSKGSTRRPVIVFDFRNEKAVKHSFSTKSIDIRVLYSRVFSGRNRIPQKRLAPASWCAGLSRERGRPARRRALSRERGRPAQFGRAVLSRERGRPARSGLACGRDARAPGTANRPITRTNWRALGKNEAFAS